MISHAMEMLLVDLALVEQVWKQTELMLQESELK